MERQIRNPRDPNFPPRPASRPGRLPAGGMERCNQAPEFLETPPHPAGLLAPPVRDLPRAGSGPIHRREQGDGRILVPMLLCPASAKSLFGVGQGELCGVDADRLVNQVPTSHCCFLSVGGSGRFRCRVPSLRPVCGRARSRTSVRSRISRAGFWAGRAGPRGAWGGFERREASTFEPIGPIAGAGRSRVTFPMVGMIIGSRNQITFDEDPRDCAWRDVGLPTENAFVPRTRSVIGACVAWDASGHRLGAIDGDR